MHSTFIPMTLIALACATPVTSAAQTITLSDPDGARASVKAGYGGHGLDWEASFDTPLLAFVRVRAGVGQGRWVDWTDPRPPAGSDPTVARIAASVIFFGPPHGVANLRRYGGMGISAYVPRGVDMSAQRGLRFIFGVEGSGGRWTVGPEIELDGAHPNGGSDLWIAGRFGIAIRRHL